MTTLITLTAFGILAGGSIAIYWLALRLEEARKWRRYYQGERPPLADMRDSARRSLEERIARTSTSDWAAVSGDFRAVGDDLRTAAAEWQRETAERSER